MLKLTGIELDHCANRDTIIISTYNRFSRAGGYSG